jgi:glutathione S-transferase
LRLYDYMDSGNGYKVRLLLAHLHLPYELVEKDIEKGETRTPEFLALNPNGRVPVLELEDGTALAESNAILYYLADGTPYLPSDRLHRAQALQWMFFEQYSHEPYIAVVRFWRRHGLGEATERDVEQRMQRGYAALEVMERQLTAHPFLLGNAFSIADIALYAYTHVARQGGFDLDRFPNTQMWLQRVAQEPRHVTMEHKPG